MLILQNKTKHTKYGVQNKNKMQYKQRITSINKNN